MGALYDDGSSQENLLLKRNILDALGEDPSYTSSALAEKFGTGTYEVEEALAALETDGKIGNGRRTPIGEIRTNGKRRPRINPRKK